MNKQELVEGDNICILLVMFFYYMSGFKKKEIPRDRDFHIVKYRVVGCN